MQNGKMGLQDLGESEKHSQAELEAKALNFLKRNKPKEYKALSPYGRLEYARLKANAAKRYAENLIASGEPDFVAWNRAIRLEILESESG